MRYNRFSEKQIIGVLKKAEAGAKTADLTRRLVEWKAPLKLNDLPPSEWPIFCFRIGHEGGMEWQAA